jgi:outer membrane protein
MMLKMSAAGVVLALLPASGAFAQTAPAPTPAAVTPAPPVALFPANARFAFVDFQRIASTSMSGKLAARLLKEFSDKKLGEIEGQNKQLEALNAKRGAGILSGPSLAKLDKDMARLQREVQFLQQHARAEFEEMQNELQSDLEKRVVPAVAGIAKERGLDAVFTANASVLYVLPALDISDEVIKRIDAQPKKQP